MMAEQTMSIETEDFVPMKSRVTMKIAPKNVESWKPSVSRNPLWDNGQKCFKVMNTTAIISIVMEFNTHRTVCM